MLGATIIQALFFFAVDNKVDFVERPLNGIAGKHVANLCCGDTLGWFTAVHAHEKIDEQVRDVARQQWAAAFWDVAEELWGGGEEEGGMLARGKLIYVECKQHTAPTLTSTAPAPG